MSEYLLILVWLAFMALFQHFVQTEEYIDVAGRKKPRKTWWFALLVIAPLVWMSMNRGRYIGDTLNYIRTFENTPNSLSAFSSFYQSLTKDKWFYASETLIHIFITKDYKIFFLILALFQMYSLAKLYRRYSPEYLTAIFIFVACSDYISWMYNGVRQFTAVCICLLATTWMIERKYIPAILTFLIASRFHGTALLMIPIFLVCTGRPWNARTLVVLFGVLLAILFVSQFTNWLDTALEETQYENVVTDWIAWKDDGTNPLRVLVYSVPMILSLVGLRYIREANDPVINFATNMSIMTAGLYLVSMVTSGIFIGRLPIYTSLYSNGILLPWEVKHIFNKESSRLIYIAMIGFYLLFYIYQMHIQWNFF